MAATVFQNTSARARLIHMLLVMIFIVAAAIRIWAIANTDQLDIGWRPFVDDSYYYFSLGRNLADTLQPRIDSFNLTTGFQPLWGFLVAIPYLIFPDATAITVIQAMGALLSLGAGAVIYALTYDLTRSRLAGVINAGTWLLMPYSIREGINGMETSLATFSLLLAAWLFHRFYAQPTQRRLIVAGLAGGLAILSRVDLSIFTAAASLFMFVFPPSGYKTLVERLRLVITFGIVAALPTLPWVIFALLLGKSPLPESGPAVRALAYLLRYRIGSNEIMARSETEFFRNNLSFYMDAIANQVVWFAPLRRGLLNDLYVWLIALGGVGLIAFIRRSPVWRVLTTALIVLAVMTVAYLFVIPASWYFDRYLHPLTALLSCVLGIALAYWALALGQRSGRLRWIGGVVLVVYAAAVIFFGFYTVYRSGFDTIVERISQVEYDTAVWVNTNLPSDALVGAYQSGLVGYYVNVPHVNLDGVANGDAYEALENGETWGYVCSQGITHLVEQTILLIRYLYTDEHITSSDSLDPAELLSPFGTIEHVENYPGNAGGDYVVLRVDPDKCYSEFGSAAVSR